MEKHEKQFAIKKYFFPLLHAYEGSLLCSRCVLFFFLQFILLPQLRESRCFASAPRTNDDDDEDVELYRSLERIYLSELSVRGEHLNERQQFERETRKFKGEQTSANDVCGNLRRARENQFSRVRYREMICIVEA